jgi:hypothetical protein
LELIPGEKWPAELIADEPAFTCIYGTKRSQKVLKFHEKWDRDFLKAAVPGIGDLILIQLTHFYRDLFVDQEIGRYIAIGFVSDILKTEMAKIFVREFF